MCLFIWWLLWTLFATFRYVSDNIGGTDTPEYIEFFNNCLRSNSYDEHMGYVFTFINRTIRTFTPNYLVFFFIVYGFQAWVIIRVCLRFCEKGYVTSPLLLLFYFYLRSFNTLRSNLAISFLLLGLVLFYNRKKIPSIVLFVLSCLTHYMCVLFVPAIAIIRLFEKKQVSFLWVVIFVIMALPLAQAVQPYILLISAIDDSVYGSYITMNSEVGFFEGAWITPLGQIMLGVALVLYDKEIRYSLVHSFTRHSKYCFMRSICFYDLMMVPINHMFNIWRGYEVFYIFRLIMWTYVIQYVYEKKLHRNKIVVAIASLVFVLWFVWRLSRTYEDSNLMPYHLIFFS